MTVTAGSVMGAGYRPAQWANGVALYSIVTSPVFYVGTGDTTSIQAGSNTSTTYVFDAVLETAHEQRVEKTHHPVQTGADVSSHAYIMPARLAFSIGMSDAMDSFTYVLQGTTRTLAWSGDSSSKSVNAYQTLLSLAQERNLLTVTTRLHTYSSMLIVSLTAYEDKTTVAGLRARVEFEEVMTAAVSTGSSSSSSRSDVTQQTDVGSVTPTSVPVSTQNQYKQSDGTYASDSGGS